MLPWQVWLIIAGLCFIIEIATVGFLIFWFGVSALLTCLVSLFVPNVIAQTAIFIILSIFFICLSRPFANKIGNKDQTVTNSNAVIGKEGIVTKTINVTPGEVGQVKVSSDIWSAVATNYTGSIPVGSTVRVLSIDGVKLVIDPITIAETTESAKK